MSKTPDFSNISVELNHSTVIKDFHNMWNYLWKQCRVSHSGTGTKKVGSRLKQISSELQHQREKGGTINPFLSVWSLMVKSVYLQEIRLFEESDFTKPCRDKFIWRETKCVDKDFKESRHQGRKECFCSCMQINLLEFSGFLSVVLSDNLIYLNLVS